MSRHETEIKVIDRKLMCSNTRFNIYFDHIVEPNGEEVPNYLMIEPKVITSELMTGVLVLPLMGDKIGLVRVYRHIMGEDSWEVVKGFIEQGEKPELAALRELREEAQCVADISQLVPLSGIAAESGVIRGRNFAFVAKNCRIEEEIETDELGLKEFTFFTPEEVSEMLKAGKIFDAGSLGCICLYLNNIKNVMR